MYYMRESNFYKECRIVKSSIPNKNEWMENWQFKKVLDESSGDERGMDNRELMYVVPKKKKKFYWRNRQEDHQVLLTDKRFRLL